MNTDAADNGPPLAIIKHCHNKTKLFLLNVLHFGNNGNTGRMIRIFHVLTVTYTIWEVWDLVRMQSTQISAQPRCGRVYHGTLQRQTSDSIYLQCKIMLHFCFFPFKKYHSARPRLVTKRREYIGERWIEAAWVHALSRWTIYNVDFTVFSAAHDLDEPYIPDLRLDPTHTHRPPTLPRL